MREVRVGPKRSVETAMPYSVVNRHACTTGQNDAITRYTGRAVATPLHII
jgi:hypothetical protein